MKKNLNKCLNFIYLSFCFAGLLWQSTLIFDIYFQFRISSRISIFFPDIIDPYDVSICIRYTDVLDYNRLNRATKRNWSFSYEADDVRKYQHEINIQENYTSTSFFVSESDSSVCCFVTGASHSVWDGLSGH